MAWAHGGDLGDNRVEMKLHATSSGLVYVFCRGRTWIADNMVITDTQQIDFHIGVGLNRNAPAYIFGVGYSFRIDGLYQDSRTLTDCGPASRAD
jgi:hypothetical protein